MQDEVYRKTIRQYDLRTLLAARTRLDAAAHPDRVKWLDEEIRQRADGVAPEPAAVPARLDLSRDEGYAGFVYRLPALALDLLLVFTLFGWTLEGLMQLDAVRLIPFVPWVIPAWLILTTHWLGGTPGKWALGLRVTDTRFKAVSIAALLRRHLPDLLIAALMSGGLVYALATGLVLPEHGTVQTKVDTLVTRTPLWRSMHTLWYIWFWSELLFLAVDRYRRALPELVSGTLVIHRDNHPAEPPAPYPPPDWLAVLSSLAARTRTPGL